MGSCRSIVIDAILKTLATLLVPLSANITAMDDQEFHNDDVTGAKTDFQLITWLLLFLSVCLDDGIDKKEQSSMRWDFMSGEANVSKARAQTITNNSGRSFSRSFKKRFLQSKQSTAPPIDKIYINDKAVQVAQLTSQIEYAFKQHESFLKKKKLPVHELIMGVNDKMKLKNSGGNNSIGNGSGSSGGGGAAAASSGNCVIGCFGGGGSGSSSSGSSNKQNLPPKMKETRPDKEQQTFDKGLKSLKSGNIIIVIRGMIGLLLAMDYTCNMDLFLLTCKVGKQISVFHYSEKMVYYHFRNFTDYCTISIGVSSINSIIKNYHNNTIATISSFGCVERSTTTMGCTCYYMFAARNFRSR